MSPEDFPLFPRVATHGSAPLSPRWLPGYLFGLLVGGFGNALPPAIFYVGQLPSKRAPGIIRSWRSQMICSFLLFLGISISATVVDPDRTLSVLREIAEKKRYNADEGQAH